MYPVIAPIFDTLIGHLRISSITCTCLGSFRQRASRGSRLGGGLGRVVDAEDMERVIVGDAAELLIAPEMRWRGAADACIGANSEESDAGAEQDSAAEREVVGEEEATEDCIMADCDPSDSGLMHCGAAKEEGDVDGEGDVDEEEK